MSTTFSKGGFGLPICLIAYNFSTSTKYFRTWIPFIVSININLKSLSNGLTSTCCVYITDRNGKHQCENWIHHIRSEGVRKEAS